MCVFGCSIATATENAFEPFPVCYLPCIFAVWPRWNELAVWVFHKAIVWPVSQIKGKGFHVTWILGITYVGGAGIHGNHTATARILLSLLEWKSVLKAQRISIGWVTPAWTTSCNSGGKQTYTRHVLSFTNIFFCELAKIETKNKNWTNMNGVQCYPITYFWNILLEFGMPVLTVLLDVQFHRDKS